MSNIITFSLYSTSSSIKVIFDIFQTNDQRVKLFVTKRFNKRWFLKQDITQRAESRVDLWVLKVAVYPDIYNVTFESSI